MYCPLNVQNIYSLFVPVSYWVVSWFEFTFYDIGAFSTCKDNPKFTSDLSWCHDLLLDKKGQYSVTAEGRTQYIIMYERVLVVHFQV
jgi:hypothetical protein